MEHLVDNRVLEYVEAISTALEHELSGRILSRNARSVDAQHVAILNGFVIVFHPMPCHVRKPIAWQVGMRRIAVVVALQIVHIKAHLLAKFAILGRSLKRGELANKQVDGLWLELVDYKVDQPVKVVLAQGIARRLGTINIDKRIVLAIAIPNNLVFVRRLNLFGSRLRRHLGPCPGLGLGRLDLASLLEVTAHRFRNEVGNACGRIENGDDVLAAPNLLQVLREA